MNRELRKLVNYLLELMKKWNWFLESCIWVYIIDVYKKYLGKKGII